MCSFLELFELSNGLQIFQSALICLFTLNACKFGWEHDSNKWGHVSHVSVLQSVQLGFGY